MRVLDFEDAVVEGNDKLQSPEKPDPFLSPAYLAMIGERELCRGLAFTATAVSGPGLGISNAIKRENPHCSWEMRYNRRFNAFSKIQTPPFLNYNHCKSLCLLSERGEDKQLEGVKDTVSLTKKALSMADKCLTNAKNSFNRIRMISKEMEKGTPANASIRDAWGQYSTEQEERNAVDKAADNMRIALTC
ncbi:MAG: hypothetical protein VXZ58_02570, partial [Actinomycetota bacterium]|nr:hypothetical protein [Actinomycetota bacterium]